MGEIGTLRITTTPHQIRLGRLSRPVTPSRRGSFPRKRGRTMLKNNSLSRRRHIVWGRRAWKWHLGKRNWNFSNIQRGVKKGIPPTIKEKEEIYTGANGSPIFFKKNAIKEYHDSLLAGHLAFLRTYFRIRDKFYWPEMMKDVKKYCKSCEVCALQRKVLTRAYLHPLEIATAPFEVIGMDFLGQIKPWMEINMSSSWLTLFQNGRKSLHCPITRLKRLAAP